MLFQSGVFLFFLSVVLVAYWGLPGLRPWLLGVANALFYAVAGWSNLALFLGASLLTYGIGKVVDGPLGRSWLWVGVALNLANLAFFKYMGFLGSNLGEWLHLAWLDSVFLQGVLLPIGISFYTFQHISYLVDRHKRGLTGARNYLHFWVYISFFGHSIAGPIMRGSEFLPQLLGLRYRAFDALQFHHGLVLFGFGLAKKVVVADHVAKVVNELFARSTTLGFLGGWTAALLFTFQIYYDFSAYSDMAVGVGKMFGFELTQNFRTPYIAANASEFWQRWHVTLSAWIRDYVYIPLGGNRRGTARSQLNLVLAMLASGLWHGANWTFVMWGAFHGVLLLSTRAWWAAKERLRWRWFESRAYHALAVGSFFGLIVTSWVLFRSKSLDEAAWIYLGMFQPVTTWREFAAYGTSLALGAGLYGLVVLEWFLRERAPNLKDWWLEHVSPVLQGLSYAALAVVLAFAYGGAKDFIYFKF